MGAYGSPDILQNGSGPNEPKQKKKMPLWGIFATLLILLFVLFVSTGLGLSSAFSVCGVLGIILYLFMLIIAAIKKRNKKPYVVGVTISAFIMIFGALIFNLNSNTAPKSIPTSIKSQSSTISATSRNIKNDPMEVDYKTLHKEYMDNPIGADEKYKGKTLILTGKIDSIDREIVGNPYVTFPVSTFENVRITFDKAEESKVAKFKKGQTIKITGECRGTLISTTVSMNNCLIVE